MIFVRIFAENAEESGTVSFFEFSINSVLRYSFCLFQSRTGEVEKAKVKNEF